jgi:hypothetical protein
LILVLVTLFGALPIYARVAEQSPDGQGSIALLENLLPRWRGKVFVLVLLGFAATSWIITITLSAADATAHIIENPFVPRSANHPIAVTLILLALLGAIFLKGFKEALGVAAAIVVVFLAFNLVVVAYGLSYIAGHLELVSSWESLVVRQAGSPVEAVIGAALLFPRLALGLSGFETGVAVMPLVSGEGSEPHEELAGRIRNTKKLLLAAALIMSVMLMTSSIVTTLLIPAAAFEEGGEANGRALAYLAHRDLGEAFGTAYDISTITILWFAGASAVAGLLNLVPKYLPRYGMAPEWAKSQRPLVIVIVAICIVITIVFKASVDAQAGAYATGVLALIASSAVAVMLSAKRGGRPWLLYGIITAVFVYTTAVNIIEKPEGIKIASLFIVGIVIVSMMSRAMRVTELRVIEVKLDDAAGRFVDEVSKSRQLRIIANRPDTGDKPEYDAKLREASDSHNLNPSEPVLFLEVLLGDASDFSGTLDVEGRTIGGHRVLRCRGPAVPNAIAALLLHVRDRTKLIPHAYFGWTEGNPITYVLKYLALGEGDTAPVTREVLRQAERDPHLRPRIHLG